MKTIIPIIWLVFLQCGLQKASGIDDCSEGFFSLRDNISDKYILKEIPDMTVALGDTAWLKDNPFKADRSFYPFFLYK